MLKDITGVIGGLGLFLLGMSVMTEGLKNLAGESLRQALSRFTRSPLTGAATGLVVTAIIQSSSATTVMAVGFVGAGLLTFTQALGIILGANIGTTLTGWLVALLGFKLDLKETVLPVIFLGAMLRLFGRGRGVAAGNALAGFGLVFAGIAALQGGLLSFRDVLTPETFPAGTALGRLLLVLLGVLITLVTQSSSAGVAVAITALHSGNINLTQAGSLVIGMDVGTTVSAAMAAIGGSVNARRTGWAHVIYNLFTATGAFFLLPFFVIGWAATVPAVHANSEIGLVTFHTLFNVTGVLIVLPFSRQFAALIQRLVPAAEHELSRRLEPSLLNQPQVAIDSVLATLHELAGVVFSSLATVLESGHRVARAWHRLDEAGQAASETRRYLNQIDPRAAGGSLRQRHSVAIHVLDHTARLITRCRKLDRLRATRSDPELVRWGSELAAAIRGMPTDSADSTPDRDRPSPPDATTAGTTGETAATSPPSHALPAVGIAAVNQRLESLWRQLDERIEPFRRETIDQTSAGETTTDGAIARLDAIRWLRRITYHAWRIVYHLSKTEPAAKVESPGKNSGAGPGP
jgi:phosphate:Na+ symporter